VRGTTNNEHIPEPLVKGILRARHDIYVNKDGTLRYDASTPSCPPGGCGPAEEAALYAAAG
jgi:hypothetical protein